MAAWQLTKEEDAAPLDSSLASEAEEEVGLGSAESPSPETVENFDEGDEFSGSELTPEQERFRDGRSAFIAHFRAVDEGRYSAAYRHLSQTYETSLEEWIEPKRTERPDIAIDDIRVRRADRSGFPGELWLDVSLTSRDRGGASAGVCREFFGEVRMFREGGRWTYRPGPYRGEYPTFANEDRGGGIRTLPNSNGRCP